MDQLAQVFVAFVKVLVVKVELELVALVVRADDGSEYLRLSYEVFADELNAKFRVKIVFENLHRGKCATR